MDTFTRIEYHYLNVLGSITPWYCFSTLDFWLDQPLFWGYIHYWCKTTPIFQVSQHCWRFSNTTFPVRGTRVTWVYLPLWCSRILLVAQSAKIVLFFGVPLWVCLHCRGFPPALLKSGTFTSHIESYRIIPLFCTWWPPTHTWTHTWWLPTQIWWPPTHAWWPSTHTWHGCRHTPGHTPDGRRHTWWPPRHTPIRLTHHSTLQETNSTFQNRRRVHLYTPSPTRTCNTAYDTPLLWRNAHISNGGLAVGFVRSSIPICRPVQVVLNAGTLHCSQPGPGLWFPVLFLQIVRDSNLFLILRYQLDGLAHNTQIHHHPHTRPESNTSRTTERSHNRTGTRCANCHRKDK